MKRIRGKSGLQGEVTVPGDKSITHRAVILASLSEGKSQISGYLSSEDCERTITAFRQMGVAISSELFQGSRRLTIEGGGLWGLTEPRGIIDCGNSGTTMRLLCGLLSGQSFFSVLTGDESLLKRPMRRVVDPLRMMGAEISGRADGGLAPLAISGKRLSSIDYKLPIPSAQVKSAILLGGLTASGRTMIEEPRPSRDHTERMFQHFGVHFEKKGEVLSVVGGHPFRACEIDVPGDISSAAFFLVAGIIMDGSDLCIRKVGVNPSRTGLIDVLQKMGADICIKPLKSVSHEPIADFRVRSSRLKGILIEGEMATKMLDEFPILCIAAAAAEGKTVFRGAEELRYKESDRIEMMAAALRGMGIDVETFQDGMEICGKKEWTGTACRTGGDHRIAMAMAVAGLMAEGGNAIDNTDCINTSFPGFFDLLSALKS
ncbi:MAG: 3-phosphoshikimate 1-carboxyvinyltransferase [Nitrospiria bacterium]